jgi:hypothetical protein
LEDAIELCRGFLPTDSNKASAESTKHSMEMQDKAIARPAILLRCFATGMAAKEKIIQAHI